MKGIFFLGLLALNACFPEINPPKGYDTGDTAGTDSNIDTDTGETAEIIDDSGETGETGEETGEETGDPCTEITWYADADSDGYGDLSVTSVACEQPIGFVADATDCDDGNGSAFPGNTEVCDGVDNDCSGTVDEGVTTTYYADADSDGYGSNAVTQFACSAPTGYTEKGDDCDDAEAAYNPGAAEEDCTDPADYNCDGSTGYADADSDSWAACEECNDADATINPTAAESCNSTDDDCDGDVDEDLATATFYQDADSDGFGNEGISVETCDGAPAGYVADGSDCDDADSTAYPSAPEDCTSSDDLNCDGSAGGDDSDGDGWRSCEECDDANPDANPGELEACDGGLVDEDCDGLIDDEDLDVSDQGTWYTDADADGYGDSTGSTLACDQPDGYVGNGEDCDDGSADAYPGNGEWCDGVDNDCSGDIDDGVCDSGGSGVDTAGGGDTGIVLDTGVVIVDTGDTGSTATVLFSTDFGDGGTCTYAPFVRSDGGSMAYASYDDGAGGCGVHVFGSGSSSGPYIALSYSSSSYTPTVSYTVEMTLENLTASSLTVYADFGGGSIVSQSVAAGSTAAISLAGTSDSSGAATLQVWTSYVSNYAVTVEDFTISY